MDKPTTWFEKAISNPIYPLIQVFFLGVLWVMDDLGWLDGHDWLGRMLLLLVLLLLISKMSQTQQPIWLVLLVTLLGLANVFYDSFMGWLALTGSDKAVQFFLMEGYLILTVSFFLVLVWSCFLRRKSTP